MDTLTIQEQVEKNRRSVAFDSYDITVRQLYNMITESMIDITPEYQRHFVWDETRQSQLIESLFLGIPIPSLFMATNRDSTWEVIDGLQRLTTIINFVGDEETIKKNNPNCSKLKLTTLDKLNTMNDLLFEELPKSFQYMFMTRPVRVTVLNDRSDFNIRYDLFERLNTGGVSLHPQEIRNCVYLGEFNDFLKECSENKDFLSVVKLTKNAERTGNLEELVLKFFAYYEDRNNFIHSVKNFLNDFMSEKTKSFKNKKEYSNLFKHTFSVISKMLPQGIVRGNRKNITPLILFEAIAIGVADCIKEGYKIDSDKLQIMLDDPELNKITTGATNSRIKLNQRIDFVSSRIRL